MGKRNDLRMGQETHILNKVTDLSIIFSTYVVITFSVNHRDIVLWPASIKSLLVVSKMMLENDQGLMKGIHRCSLQKLFFHCE